MAADMCARDHAEQDLTSAQNLGHCFFMPERGQPGLSVHQWGPNEGCATQRGVEQVKGRGGPHQDWNLK